MKNKIRRSVLRVASNDEKAFRDTLGAFEVFYRLGLRTNELSVGMLEKATKGACSPAVIIKQLDKAVTYRFDNLTLTGTTEQCDKRWREWVLTLVGSERDLPKKVRDSLYEGSHLSSEKAREALTEMLTKAGIVLRQPEGD